MLTRVPGLGAKGITAILNDCHQRRVPIRSVFGTPEADLQSRYGLRAETARRLASEPEAIEDAAKLLETVLDAHRVQVIPVTAPEYPRGVARHFRIPPPLLFAHGSLSAANVVSVAVVSSGSPTPWALEVTASVTAAAASAGASIVTGHNRPAYQEAALVGKRLGTPVVVGLDRGILTAFRGDLGREIFAAARIYGYEFPGDRDLVLSPFRPEDHWVGHNNQVRDALVIGLASIVIAVEVRAGGVMHAQCLRAKQCGKKVLVCEAGTAWPEASGNAAMIEAGFERVAAGELCSACVSAVLEAKAR
ncbi:MAG: hypothetical protein ACUVTZ_11875 [Armatimonadota bacterium]